MRFGVGPSRLSVARSFVVVLSVGLASVGCAHADAASDRHMREMRQSLDKLEVEQDRSHQRFELLESAEDPKPTRPPERPAAAPGSAMAPGRTVQIGDAAASTESDDPNDPAARPEIRVQGPGGSRPARGKSSTTRGRSGEKEKELRSDLDDASSRGDASDRERRAPILDPDAKKAYDAALALVNGRQYDRALEALQAFLVRWPDHPYAENAMYWRGESYYARGEYLRAAEQFEAVVTRGLGQKASDALLKLGLCHERLGASERAAEYWDRLRRDYPRSDAAKKIPAAPGERAPSSKNDRGAGPQESR